MQRVARCFEMQRVRYSVTLFSRLQRVALKNTQLVAYVDDWEHYITLYFQSIMGQLVDDEVEIPASLRNETASSMEDERLSRSEVSDWDNCATNGKCDTLRPAMKLTVKVRERHQDQDQQEQEEPKSKSDK